MLLIRALIINFVTHPELNHANVTCTGRWRPCRVNQRVCEIATLLPYRHVIEVDSCLISFESTHITVHFNELTWRI